jgi:hypothetical protein
VFVCDNLALSGDFLKIMRKHTGDAWSDLELLIMGGIAKLEQNFNLIDNEASAFEDVGIDQPRGWRDIGELMGRKLITSVQANEAIRQWNDEDKLHAYGGRTAWALYNSVNVGLKVGQPAKLMKQYTHLHDYMRHNYLDTRIEDAVVVGPERERAAWMEDNTEGAAL